MQRWWWLCLALSFVACSESEKSICGADSDCASNQTCEDGACVTLSQVECTGDPDCDTGEQCLNGTCLPLPRYDVGTDNNDPDMSVEPDVPEPDMPEEDNVNPEVVSILPADGDVGVVTDTVVKVTFSEPMDLVTVNFQSLVLKNPAGQEVPAMVTYDPVTFTATLTPTAPLREATGYRVAPTPLIRDQAGNSLRVDPSPDATFLTTFGEPADHTMLAQEFAPVLFQSIENPTGGLLNTDLPTRVNFDNNWRARDNKSKSRLASTTLKASMYYSVVESKTHYFITYALYYATRRDKNLDLVHEHDFTGVVMVVDKATRSLKLVEGLKVDDGSDTIIAYKPNTSDVDGTGQPQFLETFDVADLVDGRYPLMVTSGSHEACNWVKNGPTVPAVCRHEAREFSEGPTDGVIMRPGAAQTYAMAVANAQGIKEMQYELLPLAELWARRSFVGNELLWEKVSVYTPIENRPASYSETEPVVWPNRLVSDDEISFGKPPFAWLKLPSDTNQGQWLFDPAFLLQVRYNFGPISAEYCVNPFMAINQRGDATVTECQ